METTKDTTTVNSSILVVEDEGTTALYIKRILEELGYRVVATEVSGLAAVERAKKELPDLVLMDIKLKGKMDGVEAACEIHEKLDIPIVYLTAHSDKGMLERVKITEPFGYVVKPFDTRELHSNIEIALYRHRVEKKLKSLAHYDTLTGLPNRTLFFERLNQSILYSRRDNTSFALMFLDLDGFKYVNDTMGHSIGDILLQEVAKRLTECVRESDTVARFGGDEFVLILRDIARPEDAAFIAKKMIITIGKPFRIRDFNCSIGVSIGISVFPYDGKEADILLKKADSSMYRVKELGKNHFRFFSEPVCSLSGQLSSIVTVAIDFINKQGGKWSHSDWLDFLFTVNAGGVSISPHLQTCLGLLLESLKQFYNSFSEDLSAINVVCKESICFIQTNKGLWHHAQWEVFLQNIELEGIIIDENTRYLIGNILEAIKTVYLFY
ncbi:MAG: diguanylate cyclase [Candidatus Magnetoovum sp. WYHC-5]|nr:diguanylate cyclase [Candidatus Magnetoovum sp. WYHC-5]